jgi:uncharacterized protein GlcG (DUF336 family)
MANVVKKHSISSELAQEMVNAGELIGTIGVSGALTMQKDTDCASAALALVFQCGRCLNSTHEVRSFR